MIIENFCLSLHVMTGCVDHTVPYLTGTEGVVLTVRLTPAVMSPEHDGDHAPPHLLLLMLRRCGVVLKLCVCFSLNFLIESFLKYFPF